MATKSTQQEEKILIHNDEGKALENIEKATEHLPQLNELLTKYNAFGFERKIETREDVYELVYNFEDFIQTERLKSVPDTVSGMKIDRVQFLNQFGVKPEGLDELKVFAQAFPYNNMGFTLYGFDKRTQSFIIDNVSCEKHKEDQKQYAKGNQIKLLKAADKLMEAYNELVSLGLHPQQILEPFDYTYFAMWKDGRAFPQWRLKDKGFCFTIRPEKEQ